MTTRSTAMRALALLAVAIVARPFPSHGREATGDEPEPMIVLNPQHLRFAPIPDMPDCASAAILRGDPRSGPAWVLLKLASGCRVPWHWHTANETLLVISGRGTLSMKEGAPLQFAPGAYASLPGRHAHRASCTRSCLLFNGADAAFDIHYVDDSGKEISAEKALRASPKPKGRK